MLLLFIIMKTTIMTIAVGLSISSGALAEAPSVTLHGLQYNNSKAKIDLACSYLKASKESKTQADNKAAFDKYVRIVDQIKKENLVNELNKQCPITHEVALMLERAPVHNVLMDQLAKLQAAHDQLEKEASATANAMSKYLENEKKPDIQQMRKIVEKQTFQKGE